jgi:predicted ribosome quality control (RQC) complex YloA/Tae2 family protein
MNRAKTMPAPTFNTDIAETMLPELPIARDLDNTDNLQAMTDMVEDELAKMTPPPPPVRFQLPEYVQHADGIDDVGRLSSEALVKTYEESAKKFEDTAAALHEGMKACEAETAAMVKELERIQSETEATIKRCEEAAQAYRDEAKAVFKRIQNRAMLADRVRKTCDELIGDIVKDN